MRRFADTAADRISLMIRLDPVWWTTPASHFLLGIRSGVGGSAPLEVDSFAAVQLIEMARMKMLRVIAPHIFTEECEKLLRRLIQDYTESLPRGEHEPGMSVRIGSRLDIIGKTVAGTCDEV